MTEQLKPLLPCAHCNSAARLVNDDDLDPYIFYYVACTHCGIKTLKFVKLDDAIESWNTRAPCNCEDSLKYKDLCK